MDDYFMMAAQLAGQTIGNIANIAYADYSSEKDRDFNREMYQRQVEDNRKNWEMMNAYNAPSAQRERLEAANLNPNLVYGSGGVVGTTNLPSSASASSGYSPRVRIDGLDVFGPYMQLRQYERQMELQREQINNLHSQNLLTNAQALNVEADTKNKEFLNQLNIDTRDWQLDSKQYAAAILKNQLGISRSQNEIQEYKANYEKWWHDNGYFKVEQSLRLRGMTVGIAEAMARIKQLGALAINLASQTALNYKLKDIYDAGFSPNDGKFWHVIGDAVSNLTGGKSVGRAISDLIFGIFDPDNWAEIFGDSGYYNGY